MVNNPEDTGRFNLNPEISHALCQLGHKDLPKSQGIARDIACFSDQKMIKTMDSGTDL